MTMPGLMRALERGAVRHDEDDTMGPNNSGSGNSNGWRTAALNAVWAILLLFAGWMWSSASDARHDADATQAALVKTVQQLSERVATQEEATRNIRESLQRIEAGVNSLNGQSRVR